MNIRHKRCPFRKLERDSSIYKTDEEFQYCLGEECMACIEIENNKYICGLIIKPIMHQEVDMLS